MDAVKPVNKTELAAMLAETTGSTKKGAEATINLLVEQINKVLTSGGQVRIAGLGIFKVSERKARNGVNPKTGEKIKIPASVAPTFKYSSTVKSAVKEALAAPAKKGKKAAKV
jgi:DNA-binding protein HU-beta